MREIIRFQIMSSFSTPAHTHYLISNFCAGLLGLDFQVLQNPYQIICQTLNIILVQLFWIYHFLSIHSVHYCCGATVLGTVAGSGDWEGIWLLQASVIGRIKYGRGMIHFQFHHFQSPWHLQLNNSFWNTTFLLLTDNFWFLCFDIILLFSQLFDPSFYWHCNFT